MKPSLFAHTLSVEDALARLRDATRPISRTERVALADAVGRVASRDVSSAVDVPSFDRATMDGYAVQAGDTVAASLTNPTTLTCVARVLTGAHPSRAIGPGECAEIATGAVLPAGADAVVMVERTSRSGDRVTIKEGVNIGRNVGRRGSDITAGQRVIREGQFLGAAQAGALAAVGHHAVDVFERPRVAILSSGPEVISPGDGPLAPGQVYDVNSVTLQGMVRQHGGVPVPMAPVVDSVEAIVARLEEAASCDLIVTSGGSSVGGPDLLAEAVGQCGSVVFHGVAIKPGKPTLFGRVGTAPILGMPGNPTSCLSNAYIFLVPLLRSLARLPAWQPVRRTVPLTARIPPLADRHQICTVRLTRNGAEPAFKSSADITSMATADGYVEIPPGSQALEEGQVVTVTLF